MLPIIFNFADGVIEIINGNTNWTVNGQPLQEIDYITPLTAFSIADTPASRQMQYNWVNRNHQLKNAIHDIWQQELANMGYPIGYPLQGKPIRNIAIANGSECGVTQIDNGNIMSYVKDAGRNTFLSNYIGIMDAIYGTLITNPLVVITALFPGKSYWQINFQSKYMTTLNQNKNIYHGSIKYKKKVFWFIPVSITITEKDVNQPSGVLPYDIYGGGNQKSPTDNVPLANIVSNSFGFIPTASSLDIGNGTTAINDVDYRKSYVGALPPALPKSSPFQNFVTHFDQFNPTNNNSRHISFNRRNGNWLRTELNTSITDEYTNCSYMCSSTQITGTNTLCTSANYSVPAGTTFYNWTITQGTDLVNLSANGTTNITLTALPNVSGQVILSLNMGDNGARCGNITITKTIWIGIPQFNQLFINSNAPVLCIAPANNLSASVQGSVNAEFNGMSNTEIANVINWQWEALDNCIGLYGNGKNRSVCPEAVCSTSIRVRAQNSCGWSEWYEFPVEVTEVQNYFRESQNLYSVYPNPSNDIVNIDLKNKNNLPDKEATISGELFDMMGQSKSKVKITNNKATFSVRGLTKGIYVLKIYINDQVESHQIAVE